MRDISSYKFMPGEKMMRTSKRTPFAETHGRSVERRQTRNTLPVQSQPGLSVVRVTYLPYGWVRIPAIIVGCIGILGILGHRIEPAGTLISLFNMPREAICYVITAGAAILFGISMICKKSDREINLHQATPLQIRQNWRSM